MRSFVPIVECGDCGYFVMTVNYLVSHLARSSSVTRINANISLHLRSGGQNVQRKSDLVRVSQNFPEELRTFVFKFK